MSNKLTKNLSEVTILSQGAAAFPGTLLVADDGLKGGAPTPIGLPCARLTLTVDLSWIAATYGDADPTAAGVHNYTGGGESGPVTAGWATTV